MAGFFGLFDYTKPGKGVSKEDVDKHGIALYFDILGRRLGKLMLLNMLYVLFSIPAYVIYWFVSAYILTLTLGGLGVEIEAAVLQYINLFMTVSLVLLLGTGSATAAMNYVLRKYVNDTHSWVWSDFWDEFKNSFLKGTLAFVINTVVFLLCVVAIYFYSNMTGIISVILAAVVTVFLVLFLMMQMYVYQIMASVKLKLKDIYRNAMLLTVAKLPVNIVAALAICLAIYLYNLIAANELSLILILIIFYTLPVFTQIFITNNTVNKYLIKPCEKAEENVATEE